MLYGNDEIQSAVVADIKRYMQDFFGNVVYGAMCGSISKGIQYRDSDYDTRFLYVKRDFRNHIIDPTVTPEYEIVKRYYTDGKSVPYEWIPCWELTSFFQYLKNPVIEGKKSCGLYNIVGWTLQSPYAWDPYGIQQKIMPLVNSIFEKKYCLGYYYNELKKYVKDFETFDCEKYERDYKYTAKKYMYIIHTCLQVKWVLEKNSFPPVNLISLACSIGDRDILAETESIMSNALLESNRFVDEGKEGKSSECYEVIMSQKVADMVDYSLKNTREWEKIPLSASEEKKNEVLNSIYNIIDYSINRNQKIDGVDDFSLDKSKSDFQNMWKAMWTGNEELVREENNVTIKGKTDHDCRRVRICFSNSTGTDIYVKKAYIGNKEVRREIKVDGDSEFVIKNGETIYSDDIVIYLWFDDFEVKYETNAHDNIIESVESWVYDR